MEWSNESHVGQTILRTLVIILRKLNNIFANSLLMNDILGDKLLILFGMVVVTIQ